MKRIITILLVLCCLVVRAQHLAPELKAKFDKLIDSRYKANEPGGTVLVAQNGKVLYQRGFGMANLELNVKMKPDMIFSIGSQTKQFTAVSILQLMEQGKLSVKDPISKYIDSCPPAWQPITVENLLTHSSGISDLRNSGGARGNIPALDAINMAKTKALAYTPGTKTFYANIEFVMLGYILEKVSGETVANYFRKHILIPLGMKHTYAEDNNLTIPSRVPCYLGRSDGKFSNVPGNPSPTSVGGAGGLLSNTYDMMRWYEALATGGVLKKETLEQAWKPYILAGGKASKFGYGWDAGGAVQGSPIIEHGGLAVGYSTESMYLIKEHIYIGVFLNQRGYADPTAQELAALLLGKPYPVKPIKLNERQLEVFAGIYQDSSGAKRTLEMHEHKLYYNPKGARASQIVFYKPDKFYFDDTLMEGSIKRNAQGHVTALELFDRRYLTSPGWIWNKTEQK